MKNKFILLSTLLMILWPALDLSAINIEPDKNPKINVIIYTATAKLSQVTNALDHGLHINAFNTDISSHTFSNGTGTITFAGKVTTIGDRAFYDCSGLTSVTIPNSVTTIGDHAFTYCSGLTSVTIPNSVTTIGYCAFCDCSSLTSVTIPNSVTTIGDYAFSDCRGLTSVTIPNSITTIGHQAFYFCKGLTKTNFTGTIADWCKIKFDYYAANPMYYSHNFYINDVEVKDLVIPEGVGKIEDDAFSGCSGLTSVTIPNSVTTIGEYAFYDCSGIKSVTWNAKNCNGYNFGSQVETFVFGDNVEVIPASICNGMTNLTSITIPNSVATIGDTAFFNNTYLTDVIIGANVTEIGCNAFAGDTRIENITCYAPVTPNVCNTTFGDLDKSVIYLYVPADYQRKYQVDPNWKEFDLHLIGAEQTQTGDKVTVTPSTNEATFIWPSNDKADSYSLEITKDGAVFCTLTFNAQGQLMGIAFAAGRGHTAMAHAATSTNAGWQFTVTGLNQASKYAYTMDVKNASQKSIKTYTGEFVTDGYTDLLPLLYEGKDGIGSVKFIHNGHLLIERNGILYNAHGARVK